MTHSISHQYDEILLTAMPGTEIHVIYNCESEICYDENGNEESNRLLTISVDANGVTQDLSLAPFPNSENGEQAKRFLARLRESARQALHAKLLRDGINELGQPVQSFIE